jgi:hypothetical protein
MTHVKIGSKWTGSNRTQFLVTDVVINEIGTWVHYNLSGSDKHFNCLIAAFLNRFTEEVNS